MCNQRLGVVACRASIMCHCLQTETMRMVTERNARWVPKEICSIISQGLRDKMTLKSSCYLYWGVTAEVRWDQDILTFGSRYLKRHQALVMSQKMRDLARLVIGPSGHQGKNCQQFFMTPHASVILNFNFISLREIDLFYSMRKSST